MMKSTFYIISFLPMLFLLAFYDISYSWGPQDESWVRQQKVYRKQTKEAMRIEPGVAFQIFKEGKAILISVDGAEYYARNSILGSVNIPFDKLEKSRLKLSKNAMILLYCR